MWYVRVSQTADEFVPKEAWEMTEDEYHNPEMPWSSAHPPAKVGPTYYHGTDATVDVPDLKVEKTGTTSFTLTGPMDVTRYGIFVSTSREFAQTYGQNMLSVKIDAGSKQIADAHLAKQDFEETLDPSENRALWMAVTNCRNIWEMFDDEIGKIFTDYLKSRGIKVLYFDEETPASEGSEEYVQGETWVVLDPSCISKADHRSEVLRAIDQGYPVPENIRSNYASG